MHPLQVLMWKHFNVRKRTILSTIAEFISPLLLFIIVFAIREMVFDYSKPPSSSSMMVPHNERLTEPLLLSRRRNLQRVLYYPDTESAAKLMDLVGKELQLPRLDNLPDHRIRGIYGLPSLSIMQERAKEMRLNEEAVVIFQNMTNELPTKLNYTIRIKMDFKTYRYTSLDDNDYGPHEGFGLIYQPFLRLQWAIDSSFISLRSGKPPQTVWIQEFPYVDKEEVNKSATSICSLLIPVTIISLIISYVNFVDKLIDQRATGVVQMLKMVGVTWQTLVLSDFLNMMPTVLVFSTTATVLIKITDKPLLAIMNGGVLFVFFFLFFVSMLAFGYAVSYVVRTKRFSTSIAIGSYTLAYVASEMFVYATMPSLIYKLGVVLPQAPVFWFWDAVTDIELLGENQFIASSKDQVYSVLTCLLILFLQSVLYILIAWYLNHVCPGQYGIAKPAYFLFQKSYWSRKKVSPDIIEDEDSEVPMNTDQKYFEPAPPNSQVGIKIVNVSKVFDGQKVLHNINLDVYKGEITVLLGHNGAGKTTLMSIITGMYSASEGKVFVNGHDISKNKHSVIKQIGFCPQHNVHFSHMNVLQHVMFFTLLKGGKLSAARNSAFGLLDRLGLGDKIAADVRQLSGGMRRRMQLACALAGDASVLILDEPTSGLDVETRRELWDLVLSLRGNHTVLLSTHFMEEADALASRVVAMHCGRLRTHASPMQLKRAIGTGYRLTFTTIRAPSEEAIMACIKSIVPEATMKERLPKSITFGLPATSSKDFPQLFSALESRRSELAIDSIGVGVSTLEEVFLRLCNDTDTNFSSDECDGLPPPETTMKKLTGCNLYLRQFMVLITRQLLFIKSAFLSVCIVQVILPIAIIIGNVIYSNTKENVMINNPRIAMNLGVYSDAPSPKVLYDDSIGDRLDGMRAQFPQVQFITTPDVNSDVLRAGHTDFNDYSKHLVGVELNDTDAKISYTTLYRHAAPVALNLLSNALATSIGSKDNPIVTYNHPIDGAFQLLPKLFEPKPLQNCIVWTVFIVFNIAVSVSQSFTLVSQERDGTRNVHLMSGCPAWLYWTSTFVFNIVMHFIILVIPLCVFTYILDHDKTFQQGDFILCLAVVAALGITSFAAFGLLLSSRLASRWLTGLLFAIVIVFGLILPPTYMSASALVTDLVWYIRLLDWFRYIVPVHSLAYAMMRSVFIARNNAPCVQEPTCDLPLECYFCMNKDAPGFDMIVMAIQTVVYMILVLLTEYGYIDRVLNSLASRGYSPPKHRCDDDQLRGEKTYVDKAFNLPKEKIKESMLVRDLHKNYRPLMRPAVNAVKGVSFSVQTGECFGLLGVNGAGKSTVFKMITAETAPTAGSVYCNGSLLGRNRAYMTSLGYCPQYLALDGFLSAKQTLHFVLTLRGLSADEVEKQTDLWIHIVGLEKHADRHISTYSGGMKRRITAAAALCGGATVVLLDEPSAGVDVAARRRVWRAVRHALRERRAVIITSHSMDEMETLCSRIAIMSAGEICALGSAAALKNQHAKGYALVIKLNTANLDHEQRKSGISNLKDKLHNTFTCRVVDEHPSMLHFHIDDTMPYSALFSDLENMKSSFTIIEDYAVSETTLEEVFLSFAKETQETDIETVSPV